MVTKQEIYVTEIARFFPPQGKWTKEDFFSLPDTTAIVELSEGNLIVNSPATPTHQAISGALYQALNLYVEKDALGTVFYAPIAVRLWEGKIREPDLLFVRREHLDRIAKQGIEGAPDWVAEILSPGTKQIDRKDKLAEYAQAGIPEYWLLDPKKTTIHVYVLPSDSNEYTLDAMYSAGQIARSVSLSGFEAEVDRIFPRGLPG